LYNTLLDDLEDDVSPGPEEAVELVDKVVDDTDAVDDVDDDLLVADTASPGDLEAELKAEELLAEGDSESWSDDPVRMYLTQMGEIPLLTRHEEIALAKRIEITRAKFRRKLLECDFVIQYAMRILNRVHKGELPFDRTVQVSVTDRLEKDQILGRLPLNLATAQELLCRNKSDFRTAFSKSHRMTARRDSWRMLNRRRKRAVKLVEELGLRTQRIETMIRTLEDFSRRSDELRKLIDQHKRSKLPPAELPRGLKSSVKSCDARRKRLQACEIALSTSRSFIRNINTPNEVCRKATCGSSSRLRRNIATAA